jgi:hypothetical protein
MPKIKLATMGEIPRFNHNGISVSDAWQEIDTDTLSDESRQALVDYVGRFVRVHDEDQDAFRSYVAPHGYEFKDGQITDTRSPEERERERAAQAGQQSAARPTPPRDDTQPQTAGTFQVPPGGEAPAAGGDRDAVRDSRDTSPDKPSNKPRTR